MRNELRSHTSLWDVETGRNVPVARCISESRIPSNGRPLDGSAVGNSPPHAAFLHKQAKSRQSSPVGCFAVERRIPSMWRSCDHKPTFLSVYRDRKQQNLRRFTLYDVFLKIISPHPACGTGEYLLSCFQRPREKGNHDL